MNGVFSSITFLCSGLQGGRAEADGLDCNSGCLDRLQAVQRSYRCSIRPLWGSQQVLGLIHGDYLGAIYFYFCRIAALTDDASFDASGLGKVVFDDLDAVGPGADSFWAGPF